MFYFFQVWLSLSSAVWYETAKENPMPPMWWHLWLPACCILSAPGRCRMSSCTSCKQQQIRRGGSHLLDGRHKLPSWPTLGLSTSRELLWYSVKRANTVKLWPFPWYPAGPGQKAASWEHHCVSSWTWWKPLWAVFYNKMETTTVPSPFLQQTDITESRKDMCCWRES